MYFAIVDCDSLKDMNVYLCVVIWFVCEHCNIWTCCAKCFILIIKVRSKSTKQRDNLPKFIVILWSWDMFWTVFPLIVVKYVFLWSYVRDNQLILFSACGETDKFNMDSTHLIVVSVHELCSLMELICYIVLFLCQKVSEIENFCRYNLGCWCWLYFHSGF